MISEVQVIQQGGIPLFYHSEEGFEDDKSLLQAGFISAITQFGREMEIGDIRSVQFDNKTYVISPRRNYILVLTAKEGLKAIEEYRELIRQSTQFLDTVIGDDTSIVYDESGKLTQSINDFFVDMQVITPKKFEYETFKERTFNALFSAIGYEPGKCNIGPAERNKRYAFAGAAFFASALILLVLIMVSAPPIYRLVTFFPNFFGILSLYQARTSFCVTNALSQTADLR